MSSVPVGSVTPKEYFLKHMKAPMTLNEKPSTMAHNSIFKASNRF